MAEGEGAAVPSPKEAGLPRLYSWHLLRGGGGSGPSASVDGDGTGLCQNACWRSLWNSSLRWLPLSPSSGIEDCGLPGPRVVRGVLSQTVKDSGTGWGRRAGFRADS